MAALLGVDMATLGATLGMIKATLLLPPHLGHQESGKTLQQQKVLGVSLRGNLRIVQETWDLKRPAEWPVHTVDNYKRLEKNVHGSAAIYQGREICFGRARNACRALVRGSLTTVST